MIMKESFATKENITSFPKDSQSLEKPICGIRGQPNVSSAQTTMMERCHSTVSSLLLSSSDPLETMHIISPPTSLLLFLGPFFQICL